MMETQTTTEKARKEREQKINKEVRNFQVSWYAHLSEFGRLKFSLKEVQVNELDECLNRLSIVIDQAAANLRKAKEANA